MKESPDNFLSSHRIRYDGSHFTGSPKEIVASLMALNALRTWDEGIEEFVYNVYETPNFVAVPTNPNTFSPEYVKKENKAMEAFHSALAMGYPEKVHAWVDAINGVRMVKSGSAYLPPADFDIVAHQQTHLGETARRIVADRVTVESEHELSPEQLHELSWFGTKEAFDALNAYTKEEV